VTIGFNCTSELNISGNLKNVDVSPLIKNLEIPILFSCGDFECCPPEDVKTYYKLASNAKFHIFKDCRHMTMLENPIEFLNVVLDFISKYDE
jgi:proline iminopeptidase